VDGEVALVEDASLERIAVATGRDRAKGENDQEKG
jgi:hypothetical protein